MLLEWLWEWLRPLSLWIESKGCIVSHRWRRKDFLWSSGITYTNYQCTKCGAEKSVANKPEDY